MSFFGDHRNTFFYNKQTFELDCGVRVTVDDSVREFSRLAADIARRFVDIADIFGTYESAPSFRDIRVPPIYADYPSARTYWIEKQGIELLVGEAPEYDAIEFRLRIDIRFGPTISVGRMTASEFLFYTIEGVVIETIATDLAREILSHIDQWMSTNRLIFSRNERDGELRRAIRETRNYAYSLDEWPVISNGDIWGIRVSDGKSVENEKAKRLLLSCLTKQQKKQYKKNKWFIVKGNETGLVYRIRRARQINVDLMDGNVVVKRLCTVPDEYVPIEDHMLAQKLMLETDEMDFLARAIEWSA